MKRGARGTPRYLRETSWDSPLSVGDALDLVGQVVGERHGHVTSRTPDEVHAKFGSRWAARFYGVLMKAGRARLPISLIVTASHDPAGAVIRATVRDDLGFYLVHTGLAEAPYDTAFADLLERLEQATGPPKP